MYGRMIQSIYKALTCAAARKMTANERSYVGSLVNERTRIISNTCVGPNLYVMTLKSPIISQAIEPGQFVHMKIPRMEAHILRRPFSVYARDTAQGTLEILYQVVGFGSDHMTSLAPDEEVELIGAIGNTWQVPEGAKRALLVAGGVGAAPLFLLAEQLHLKGIHVDVVLGAQTEQALVCRFRYETLLSAHPRCSTDDGTFGREGFCTSLVAEALAEAASAGDAYDYLAVCGPEPLMKIVAGMAAEADVLCQLSMERRMACGVGACLSCVVNTVAGKKRACVDGPVFNAKEVVWS